MHLVEAVCYDLNSPCEALKWEQCLLVTTIMLSECLLNSILIIDLCSGGCLLYFVWGVGVSNLLKGSLGQTRRNQAQAQAQVSLLLWNLRWGEYFNLNSCSLLPGEQCFLPEPAVCPHSILTEETQDKWGDPRTNKKRNSKRSTQITF